MDRTKESLFNILQNYLEWDKSAVLDLFSGTGNISLEAASRGAQSVVSVDQHSACAAYIRKMAEELQFTQIKVYCKDVLKWYPSLPGSYDFIFLDPPYQLNGQAELVHALLFGKWLNPKGILVLEHNPNGVFSHVPGFTEMRKYGQSAFSFFTKPVST
jgi:16S rRNA (guanine(966)-N(2))-methyltransferase RsmD